jgi:hypothetical protein
MAERRALTSREQTQLELDKAKEQASYMLVQHLEKAAGCIQDCKYSLTIKFDIERSADLSAVKATATYSRRHKDEVREFVTGNEQKELPFEDEGED